MHEAPQHDCQGCHASVTINRSMNALICTIRFASALAAAVLLTGCGYTLHGRVVEAGWSGMVIAPSAKEAAAGQGVPGVRIAIYRDPGRLSQELIATGTSADDGTFAISLPGAFGAGWMEEVWLIQASRRGFTSIEETIALPLSSASRPLIINIMPGRSTPFAAPDDFHRDIERFQ